MSSVTVLAERGCDLLSLTNENRHDIASSVQHFEQDCASILLCPLN